MKTRSRPIEIAARELLWLAIVMTSTGFGAGFCLGLATMHWYVVEHAPEPTPTQVLPAPAGDDDPAKQQEMPPSRAAAPADRDGLAGTGIHGWARCYLRRGKPVTVDAVLTAEGRQRLRSCQAGVPAVGGGNVLI